QAIWFRDGTCQVAGCTVPAENCDIDHIQPHPDGPTRGDNLQALCRRHHRIKTAGFDVLITQPGAGTHRATAETLVPRTPESLHRVINTTSASSHR
ncbi:HNH endonuclease, partial [Nesterenkonia massiliensis]